MAVALAVGGLHPCCAEYSVHTEQIEQAIQDMLSGLGHKVVMQPRIDAVAAFGDDAVPLLIDRYRQTADDRCWPLISALCQIRSSAALQFVRQILKEHTKRYATSASIREYPIENEDDIIGLLIELLRVDEQQYDATERLKKMLDRKPSRAGQLVGLLRDDSDSKDFNYRIGEILAFVSGYSDTWCVWIPPGQDRIAFRNAFWQDWWKRNRERDVFGWLTEAVSSDNDSRQAQALQRMWATRDRRAIPYFIAGLNSPSEQVRYWAVVGLKQAEGSMPDSGYLSETFQQEKGQIITRLKVKFGKKTIEPDTKTDAGEGS